MLIWMALTACGSNCEEVSGTTARPATCSDSAASTTDTVETGEPTDSEDTTDTQDTSATLLDVSGWDPYVVPTIEVTPVPLVPGGEATITYRGELAGSTDLMLHYGFNGWNEVAGIDGLEAFFDTGDDDWYVQADMAPTGDGAWAVTVPLPTDGRALHMVVYDRDADVWDNNSTDDYAESLVFPYAGPYLGWNGETDPTTGVVVAFATAVPCLGTVEYGETPEFGQVAVGTDFGSKHHVTLQDLTPDSTVYYRVYDARGRVSETYSFKTVAADTDQATLLVMGDMQDGGATQRWDQVAVELAASHSDADAVFLVGDMAYNDKPGHWWTFFDRGREVFSRVPLLPVPGNHDTPGTFSTNDLTRFVSWFDLPWADGAGTSTDSRWLLQVGPMTLMGLNSEDTSGFVPDVGNQYTWAAQALDEISSPWVFAAWHNPPYNVGRRHYLEQHDFRAITEHFEGRLDWVFSGHEHMAQRIHPMRYNSDQVVEYGRGADQGVGYLIAPPAGNAPSPSIVETTSGDAHYRDRLAFPAVDPKSDTVDSELGFVRVELDGEELTMRIYGMGVLDAVTEAVVREELSYTRTE